MLMTAFRRRANWHLCPFGCVRRRATRACPARRFLIARARARRASSRSRAPRIASRPARRVPLAARDPPRVMANVRHVPTVPFAASAMEGAVRTARHVVEENLAVGAFGGVLPVHSGPLGRGRARARSPLARPPPLSDLLVRAGGCRHPSPPPATRGSERSAVRARRARACASRALPNPLLSPPRRPRSPYHVADLRESSRFMPSSR